MQSKIDYVIIVIGNFTQKGWRVVQNDYRKTKYFNEEQLDYIREELGSKQSITTISRRLGISPSTFRKYVSNSDTSINDLRLAKNRTGVLRDSTSIALELRRLVRKYPNYSIEDLSKRVGLSVSKVERIVDYYKIKRK